MSRPSVITRTCARGLADEAGDEVGADPRHVAECDDYLVDAAKRGILPVRAQVEATLPFASESFATVVAAELIEADHELGRLAPGYLADIIAVPGDPSRDIATTLEVSFVMKDGQIHQTAAA